MKKYNIFYFISLSLIVDISYVQYVNYDWRCGIITELKDQVQNKIKKNDVQFGIFYAMNDRAPDLKRNRLNLNFVDKISRGDNFYAALPKYNPALGRNDHSEEQIILNKNLLSDIRKTINPTHYFLYTFNSPCCQIYNDDVQDKIIAIENRNYANLCGPTEASCTGRISEFVEENQIQLSVGYTRLYTIEKQPVTADIYEFKYFIGLIQLVATKKVTIVRESRNDANWFQYRFLKCLQKIDRLEDIFHRNFRILLRVVVNRLTWLCFKKQGTRDKKMYMFSSRPQCYVDSVQVITNNKPSERLEEAVKKCFTKIVIERGSYKFELQLGPALSSNFQDNENTPSSDIEDYIGTGRHDLDRLFNYLNMKIN